LSGGPPFLFNQISRIASLAAQRRSLRLQDRNTLLMSSYFSFWLSSKFSCFSLGSVNFRSCCALSFHGCMRVKPMAEVPTIVEVTFAAVQHRPLPVFYLGLLHGGTSLICLFCSLDLTHRFELVPAILSFTESTNPENASWYKIGERRLFAV